MKVIKSRILIHGFTFTLIFFFMALNLFPHPAQAQDEEEPRIYLPLIFTEYRYTPSKIAFFSTYENIEGEIYVVNEDGTGLIRLTNNTFMDGSSTDWSPDGKKIVFGSNRSGVDKIYTMNSDGTNVVELIDKTGCYAPQWSPLGDKIAFYCKESFQNFIYSINNNGTGLNKLSGETVSALNPAWSNDGNQIAYTTTEGDIYIFNADGSDPILLYDNDYITGYDWSPDGKHMAISEMVLEDNYKQKIFILNLETMEKTQVTNLENNSMSPSWSPDGSRIAFHSNWEGLSQFGIYTISASGSDLQTVIEPQISACCASWGK